MTITITKEQHLDLLQAIGRCGAEHGEEVVRIAALPWHVTPHGAYTTDPGTSDPTGMAYVFPEPHPSIGVRVIGGQAGREDASLHQGLLKAAIDVRVRSVVGWTGGSRTVLVEPRLLSRLDPGLLSLVAVTGPAVGVRMKAPGVKLTDLAWVEDRSIAVALVGALFPAAVTAPVEGVESAASRVVETIRFEAQVAGETLTEALDLATSSLGFQVALVRDPNTALTWALAAHLGASEVLAAMDSADDTVGRLVRALWVYRDLGHAEVPNSIAKRSGAMRIFAAIESWLATRATVETGTVEAG